MATIRIRDIIPVTPPMLIQQKLNQIAGNPRRRFRLFILGLCLFAAALSLLYAGLNHNIWLTRVGTLLLAPAFVLCATSYVALLINRLLNFFQD
ncbi:hypothetical protein [Echinimonas agarilytica]|uniref:Uncharacterized protein n=1 Tax=Echinimonas agarilytica TaxID=1215918 RepID=A0AA41W9L4_9GAMM|nr:hypothetical protein [Echinimonas agarilytica]MCM2680908.1 hypothetical protein [Echinimonas agarilytica]